MNQPWKGHHAVLKRAAELYMSTGGDIKPEQVLDAFPGEQHDDVLRSLLLWSANGYIETVTTRGMGQLPQILMITRVTEKGLREANAWPASDEQTAQVLLAALDDAVDSAPDPEQRSKLQTLRSAAGNVSINALGGIGAAIFAKLMGWP